jgi:mannosyltransferase
LNESKISVVYCGVSEAFFTKPNRTTEPYILYVGQRVAYKNFYSLVDAIQNLKDVTLLCVGGGSFSNSELEILNKKIPMRFKHAGYVSTDDLNNIYNSVLCFVYPSKYEGFGMPIIESMRAGCPVISVNNSSITEVSGGAAVLVGNGDRDEIQQAIIGMFDEEYRQNCINQGLKQSLKFSWEKMYLETVDVYKKLV